MIIDAIETLWPAGIGARPEDAAVETIRILPITLPLFRVADRRGRTAAALWAGAAGRALDGLPERGILGMSVEIMGW